MSATGRATMRSRLFARYYDRVLSVSEEAGLAERRATLLATATGRTLELGAGTGLNLDHYPEGLDSLVLTEPDRLMAQRLRGKVAERPREAFIEITPAGAERLPFPDESFDTVVSTLVLCTVPDPVAAIDEAHRVLRPGGSFLFLEHVLGEGAIARRQRLVAGPWSWVACGCRCDRPTAATIAASGLDLVELEEGRMPKATKFLKPLIQGRAIRPAM